MSKIQRTAPTKRPTSGAYFCGVLHCPVCGGKYTTKWQYSGEKYEDGTAVASYPYYLCRNANYGNCTAKGIISHRKTEKAFEEYIAHIEDFPEYDIIADTAPDNSAEINTITAEIKTIEQRTEEIIGLYVAATIDFPTYQSMVRQSNERRGALEARLKHLENTQKAKIPGYTIKEIVGNIRASWAKLDNERRLQFVQQFIKKLVVEKEGRCKTVIVNELVFNTF
jgi:hypothetical protein